MEKVAVYIRVSTRRQVDTYSPDEQKRILTEYANAKGWEIYDYYSDLGESGTDSEREDLDRLLVDASRKSFTRVLLFEQDRLSRLEQIEWAYLANSLAKMSIKLVTPTSEINLDNEEDRFLADLFNLLANRELKKTKKRTSMGRRAAHNKGVYFCGYTPFGYSIDRETQLWSVVKEEAEIVKQIFAWYDYDFGFATIAKKLNELGYKTRVGSWYFTTVHRLILNPVYMGEFEQTVLGETKRHKISWIEGHKSIIDEATFYRAQLISKNRATQYFNKPRHLIVGLLVCDECGMKLRVKGNKKNLYYLHRDEKSRCNVRFRKNDLEKKVIEKLKTLTDISVLEKALTDETKPENVEAYVQQIETCRNERKKLVNKKGRLLDLYIDGTWSKDELDEQKKKIDNDLLALKKREDDLRLRISVSTKQIEDIQLLADRLRVFHDFNIVMTPEEQISLIREYVQEINIQRNGEFEISLKVDNGKNDSQSLSYIQICS